MVELLNGRYEIGEVLGSGGMGRVFRAYDTRLDRVVAVKLLRGDHLSDENARARLRAEAQIAGGLHHPGVAQIFDYDEDAATPEHDPFIVMQLIEGTTLSESIRTHGRLSHHDVETLVRGIAEALSEAHARGIVHRDLKPANIVITPQGRPVVVDFGIASSPSREPLTATGSILGTAEYLSPEQARGRPATAASDVYALGLVAYSALTGESAFRRDSHVASALAQVQDALPSLDDSVPPHLARLVASMTAKDPEERPGAAQVVAELDGGPVASTLVDGPTTVATGLLPATGPITDPATVPVTGLQSTAVIDDDATRALPVTDASRRRRARTVYAGVGAAAVVLLLAFIVPSMGSDDATVPPVVGDTASRASDVVERAHLQVRRESVDHPTAAAGTVVAQSPKDGKLVDEGSVVTIEVASGRMEVKESSFRGKSSSTARAALEKMGFVVAVQNVTSSRTAGTVVALNRSGRLPVGTTITLSVAVAPPTPVVQQPVNRGPTKGGPGGKGKPKGGKHKP